MSSLGQHPVLGSPAQTSWYLAYTKPRSEPLAADNLSRQGYDVYCPKMKVIKPSKAVADAPYGFETLFPRYVFVRPSSPKQSIAPIKSTTGVNKLVSFGFEPALLSHAKLSQIALWLEQQHQADAAALSGLNPGTVVHITQGPFAHLQGLVKLAGANRVLVLLELMGKEHTLSFPYSALAAA